MVLHLSSQTNGLNSCKLKPAKFKRVLAPQYVMLHNNYKNVNIVPIFSIKMSIFCLYPHFFYNNCQYFALIFIIVNKSCQYFNNFALMPSTLPQFASFYISLKLEWDPCNQEYVKIMGYKYGSHWVQFLSLTSSAHESLLVEEDESSEIDVDHLKVLMQIRETLKDSR